LTVSAIDKPRHIAKYKNPYNPYHLSLRFCLERAYDFLIAMGQTNRRTYVVAEPRGKVEDKDLELEFLRIGEKMITGATILSCCSLPRLAIR